MRPVLKYPGAKWRLAPWIISHMPPHESYLETYAGSLAVLLRKQPSRIETVNDLDGDIVNFWRVCRERPDELAVALSLTPWARAEFESARNDAPDDIDDVERARRFAVRCWMAYGSSARSTGWRHTKAKAPHGGPACGRIWDAMPSAVQEASLRLRHVQIEHKDAVELIRAYNGGNVLIYADPPYLLYTRTGAYYHHEMTDADHEEMLRALLAHEGPVLLSGYDNDLYNDMLLPQGWVRDTKQTAAEKGVRRVESLWCNPAAMCGMERQEAVRI